MAMQDMLNKMKGTALGVAEYLTPVLKVWISFYYEQYKYDYTQSLKLFVTLFVVTGIIILIMIPREYYKN